MAASITLSPANIDVSMSPGMRRLKIAFVGNTTEIVKLNGLLYGMLTVPSGSAVPDDNWDFTLLGPDDTDVLNGGGENGDTANNELVVPEWSDSNMPIPLAGTYTITIAGTGVGDDKEGDIYLYIAPVT